MRHPRCPAMLTAMVITAFVGVATRDAGTVQTEERSSRSTAISVNGCVRSADQVAVGTSGSRGSTSAAESRTANDSSTKFVLTNATQIRSVDTASTSGTKNTTTAATATGYRLDADENALTPLVGHRVEISGRIENPGSTSPTTDAVFSNAPRLKVISVRTLSSTCGQ